MPNLRVVPANDDSTEPLHASVRVGKDILGLLSSAMYTEPLSIVREYVQNAADSIDIGYDSGILTSKEPGTIAVRTDPQTRSLFIRDNGVGIEQRHAEDILVAFGLSGKRGTSARGFRGIGRLGGLGFAQRVVFRTRFVGEARVSEVAWDCRALRAILLDSSERSELADVVRRVVSVRRRVDGSAPEHFFEVELQGLARLRSDRLLNVAALVEYLQQVAPLPLSPDLRFAPDINEFIGEFVPKRRIDIAVNGSHPLHRPHRTGFAVAGSKRDRFSRMQALKFEGVDGGLAAVGWILHHSYLGALQASPDIRGLRCRVGDMQVGDEALLAGAFPESRFNGWVVGELHILDRGIVPNGRRDDFETTPAYSHLANQLVPIGRELARLCRSSSMERGRLRKFERNEEAILDTAKRIRQGRITGRRKKLALTDARALLEEMSKLIPLCSSTRDVVSELCGRLRGCESALAKAGKIDKQHPLASLPSHRRAAYEEFLTVLHGAMSNRRSADALIERMTSRLVRLYGKS